MQLRTLFAASLIFMGAAAQEGPQTGRISIEEALERNPAAVEEAQANAEAAYDKLSEEYHTGRIPMSERDPSFPVFSPEEQKLEDILDKMREEDADRDYDTLDAELQMEQKFEDLMSEYKQKEAAQQQQIERLEREADEREEQALEELLYNTYENDEFELDSLSSDDDFFNDDYYGDDYDDDYDDDFFDDLESEFYDDGGLDLSHWTSTGAAGGDYFSQHLDFYNMSEEEFYQRYGYAEDPVILWETVMERIKIDLAWVYEEDFRDWDDDDWRDFHEDVVRGLISLDLFIGDEYGPAVNKFNKQLEQYQSMLDETADRELTIDDWFALKKEIFRGVRKLEELARNNKLKASGALRNKVEINTVKWEEIQTSLNQLGHMTQNQFAEVHETQQLQREQLPVWAACLITGLSVALLFTLVIACGMHRQHKKKLADAANNQSHMVQVTQRESAPTDRLGTAVDSAQAIAKMNSHH